MKLDLMLLANYAEAQNELLYIHGGGWDTINVTAPLQVPEVGPDVFAVIQGTLVVRLHFHQMETDRNHQFEVTIMYEDGQTIADLKAEFPVARNTSLPTSWLQNVNIVLPLSGVALPHPGEYVLNLAVNGQWMGDRQFRVVKAYED